MARLSGIVQADPVTYTATLGSESVTIVFDAARMTGRWERDIRQAMDAEDVDAVADKLFSVFISWDVVDDSGAPVPIAREILLDLPGKALINLFRGMQEAGAPGEAEGNASSATTVAQPSPAPPSSPSTPLNGSATLPSPSVSASPSLT